MIHNTWFGEHSMKRPKIFDPTCSMDDLVSNTNLVTWKRTNEHIVDTIKRNNFDMAYALDVGERNPRTRRLEGVFDCSIDSTAWDLDYPPKQRHKLFYDTIIFTCVIEHLYNPLTCLNELQKILRERGKMIIVVPQYKKLTSHHFHQIPDSRMRGLLNKAGLWVVEYYQFNNPFKLRQHLKGIRPFFRYFNRKVGVYVVSKKSTN